MSSRSLDLQRQRVARGEAPHLRIVVELHPILAAVEDHEHRPHFRDVGWSRDVGAARLGDVLVRKRRTLVWNSRKSAARQQTAEHANNARIRIWRSDALRRVNVQREVSDRPFGSSPVSSLRWFSS